MIRISFEFVGKKGLENLIRYVENNLSYAEVQDKTRDLAYDTSIKMREIINNRKKRPNGSRGELENAITVEELEISHGAGVNIGGVSFGVGRIANLPLYWEVLNVGGYVPPANRGYFEGSNPPMKGEGGEAWTHTLGGKGLVGDFFIKPKKAMEGIKYIDLAISDADDKMYHYLRFIGEKYLTAATVAAK